MSADSMVRDAMREPWHDVGRLQDHPQMVLAIVARGDVNKGPFLIEARAICASATS